MACSYRRSLLGQGPPNALAIRRVHPVEECKLPFDDFFRDSFHRTGDVRKETLFLPRIKKVEQSTRLAEVVVSFPMVITSFSRS